MNHNEAIKLRATEKYALGELPEDMRDAYEEHFFDCAECAMDMRAVSAFVDRTREIFGEEAQEIGRETAPGVAVVKPSGDALRGWWKGWWQPLIAVPALAALIFVVGYGARRAMQETKPVAAVAGQSTVADALQTSVHLLGDTRRGAGEAPVVRVRAGESFAVDFDFTPSQRFDGYAGQLRDATGRAVLPVTLSGETADREVHVVVPGGIVRAGKYSLVFAGVAAASDAGGRDKPVESFAFTVEIRP
jgi:hypothetical protein